MGFLPQGTTWLDIVTLLIALGGLGLALWRYKRESSVGIRVEAGVVQTGDNGVVAVIVTNTERRPVTVERVGLTAKKDADHVVFERWHSVNHRRSQSGLPMSDAPLPKSLEVGGVPYGVMAGVRSIKAAFHPDAPSWAFAVDTYRNVYWGQLPDDVQEAIRATKRRVTGPDDEYGHPTAIEIPDDAIVEPSTLYD